MPQLNILLEQKAVCAYYDLEVRTAKIMRILKFIYRMSDQTYHFDNSVDPMDLFDFQSIIYTRSNCIDFGKCIERLEQSCNKLGVKINRETITFSFSGSIDEYVDSIVNKGCTPIEIMLILCARAMDLLDHVGTVVADISQTINEYNVCPKQNNISTMIM